MLFRGVSHINLDAKGRLGIPMRYRPQIDERCQGQLVVTVDTDRCLLIYPQSEWESIESRLAALPNLHRQARRLQRLLIGHATECELDGNGRILLPPPLRDFAGIDRRVVLIGQGNKFELWDEQTWNECCESWLAEAADGESLSSELDTLSL